MDMGMTQKEFAEFMRVSQKTISRWEREDYNFTVEALVNICELLNFQFNVVIKSNVDKNKDILVRRDNYQSNIKKML